MYISYGRLTIRGYVYFIGSVDHTWLYILHSCDRDSMNIDGKEVTGDYLEK